MHFLISYIQDTISVNHNWFNACSLMYVGDYFIDQLELTRNEIRDIIPNSYKTKYDQQNTVHSDSNGDNFRLLRNSM